MTERLCECGHDQGQHLEREVTGSDGAILIVHSCWQCECRDYEERGPAKTKPARRKK